LRDELVPEQGRVILTRGKKTQHILVEVERELSMLQTGKAMQKLQVVESLQQAATSSVLRGISAVAGSDIGLHWRLGNKIGQIENNKPETSRRSVPSVVTGGTMGQKLDPIFISPRRWREAGKDGLRQIRLSIGQLVWVCHTAGNIEQFLVRYDCKN